MALVDLAGLPNSRDLYWRNTALNRLLMVSRVMATHIPECLALYHSKAMKLPLQFHRHTECISKVLLEYLSSWAARYSCRQALPRLSTAKNVRVGSKEDSAKAKIIKSWRRTGFREASKDTENGQRRIYVRCSGTLSPEMTTLILNEVKLHWAMMGITGVRVAGNVSGRYLSSLAMRAK